MSSLFKDICVFDITDSSSKLGLEMIDIFVGSELEQFKVHDKLLCAKSSFFKNMLHGQFKEAIERTVRLPDDNAVIFSLFLHWLYVGSLLEIDLKDVPDMVRGPLFDRMKLYCFAEKICQNDLMDCSISSIITLCHTHDKLPTTDIIVWVYKNTLLGSNLRKLVARIFLYVLHQGENGNGDWSLKELSDAMSTIEDLRMDVMNLLRAAKTEDATRMLSKCPDELRSCMFHKHKSGEACLYNREITKLVIKKY